MWGWLGGGICIGGGGPALLRWNMLAGLWASPQVSESALYPLLSQAPFCHFRAAVMFSEAFWVVRKSIGPGLWWGQFSAQRAGGGGGGKGGRGRLEGHNGISAPEHGTAYWARGPNGHNLQRSPSLALVLSCTQFPRQRRCPT